MIEKLVDFFVSWFANPSLLGIGLAIVFGAIWLAGYWPPLFKKGWLWAVLVSSAILSLAAVSFIQIPLQVWAGQALGRFWSRGILMSWLLLAGIPQILLSGLVQEGSKLVPVVVWWWRKGKNIDPKLGLAIGAVAGLGFGVFEAVWARNQIFAAGWSWEAVQTGGFVALAGYGLAKGRGWQFYLLASFLHGFLNYSAVLFGAGIFTVVQIEIYVAVVAVLVAGGTLWLRWRKPAVATEGASEI